mmetsp:Transcript_32958/g.70970  ORF Transcript_32958/g.70970 Transcript_32958/m.70970 type:complete len:688 (+) Transcript_32958:230-2293(+)
MAMNFYSYFVLSSLVAFGVMAHAYVVHEQFFPAVVHLSTDKVCLAVMYNFLFALFLLFGKVSLRVFIGTLRDLEVEQLVDSGRGFLADTILFLVFYAPTINNREVGTVYLIQYICCVIFMKVFHLTTQIRVSHMFEVGIPRFIVNIKLVTLMCLLLFCDVLALQYFYGVASRSSTFFTWILFEALTMSTVVLVSICKYSVHMVDLRLDNGWPGKSVCLFYIDLIHDVLSMTLFLVFMLTFFIQNPSRLPIYMMADVIQVARKLAQRLRSFRRYRRISANLDLRFPDATDEEIERDEFCVICRESLFDGSKPKKMTCGHIFHIDCLRSWLVMQQTCPTCRAEISPDMPAGTRTPGNENGNNNNNIDNNADAVPRLEAAEPPQQQAPQHAQQPQLHQHQQQQQQQVVGSFGERGGPGGSAGGVAASPAASGSGRGEASSSSLPGTTNARGAASPVAAEGSTQARLASQATGRSATSGLGASQRRIDWASLVGSSGASRSVNSPDAKRGMPDEETLSAICEIHETLKQVEEMSKFFKGQTDFWMEQVRMIQQDQTRGASVFAAGGPFMQPPSFPAAVAEATASGTTEGGASAASSSGPAAPVASHTQDTQKEETLQQSQPPSQSQPRAVQQPPEQPQTTPTPPTPPPPPLPPPQGAPYQSQQQQKSQGQLRWPKWQQLGEPKSKARRQQQ